MGSKKLKDSVLIIQGWGCVDKTTKLRYFSGILLSYLLGRTTYIYIYFCIGLLGLSSRRLS